MRWVVGWACYLIAITAVALVVVSIFAVSHGTADAAVQVDRLPLVGPVWAASQPGWFIGVTGWLALVTLVAGRELTGFGVRRRVRIVWESLYIDTGRSRSRSSTAPVAAAGGH